MFSISPNQWAAAATCTLKPYPYRKYLDMETPQRSRPLADPIRWPTHLKNPPIIRITDAEGTIHRPLTFDDLQTVETNPSAFKIIGKEGICLKCRHETLLPPPVSRVETTVVAATADINWGTGAAFVKTADAEVKYCVGPFDRRVPRCRVCDLLWPRISAARIYNSIEDDARLWMCMATVETLRVQVKMLETATGALVEDLEKDGAAEGGADAEANVDTRPLSPGERRDKEEELAGLLVHLENTRRQFASAQFQEEIMTFPYVGLLKRAWAGYWALWGVEDDNPCHFPHGSWPADWDFFKEGWLRERFGVPPTEVS